jgi:large subunit ribosomal protein L21
MKAVIKTGGKQYYVEEQDIIYVEKLDGEVGSKVTFNEVLMLGDKIGNPTVAGAKVTGEIVKHGKGKKIKIFTYKPNTTSTRKKQGHRQPYTEVKINKIG